MTGGKGLPPEVQQAILAKTDGVPLYIEELTEKVLESGLLTEGTDAFTFKASLKEMPIPDSLQALLMERVDRLGPIKEIVQIGAAIGREFTYELLRAMVEVTDSQFNSALDLFVASGLILQEGEIPIATYRFKHMLVQEAAYSTLPKKSRRLLHARIAKTLERSSPSACTWNRNSWLITMNKQDWLVRPLTIGIVRPVEMRNDQPISKRSIILIARSSCSRSCRKARNVMLWSWSSSSRAEPLW